MSALLSVYMNPNVLQAWRASVKALRLRQGDALEEALRDWMQRNQEKIGRAINPNTPRLAPVSVKVAK